MALPEVAVAHPLTASVPTVGVVVPVYRVEPWVESCIAAIAGQTRRPDQVVLVDDMGGDRSIDLALDAARRAGLDVRLVRHPQNRGLSAARNSGLRELDTDLVWFFDSDDGAADDFLAAMVGAFTGPYSADVDVAACRTTRIDEREEILGIEEPASGGVVVTGSEFARRLLLAGVRGYACNKLFRRELLGDAPYPEGQGYEDVIPMLRLALASRRIALLDTPAYRYRVTPGSLSQEFGTHTFDLLRQNHDVAEVLTVAGVLDSSSADDWRRELLAFRYDQVLLPAANMAARHLSTEDRDRSLDGAAEEVLRQTRSLVRAGHLWGLARSGALRQLVAASMLSVSPSAYRRILRHR